MSKNKFHPILFSTPMVQALIEGRKTQTRRTKRLESINENPDNFKLLTSFDEPENLSTAFYTRNNGNLYVQFMNGSKNHDIKCPYEMGDVLWVRETFRPIDQEVGSPRFEYKATEKINLTDKWKPSLFMPKQACRTFLKIQSIRVERLQEISEKDAIAEGILFKNHLEAGIVYENYLKDNTFLFYSVKSFSSLWRSINGEKSWQQNPFVWVYEFEKIDKPLDFI